MNEWAYIGLGGNLDDPQRQLDSGLEALARLSLSPAKVGSWVRSPPLGGPVQPDYLNTVCRIDTDLGADDLLQRLQQIENAHGRTRDIHWGPRTLDLDLLLYGSRIIDHARLQVPHPGMGSRPFVLIPLLDIEPALLDPRSRRPYRELLDELISAHGRTTFSFTPNLAIL